jgi:nicotinamidase-related amidase
MSHARPEDAPLLDDDGPDPSWEDRSGPRGGYRGSVPDDLAAEPWLVVIDMQRAFGDPDSGWAAAAYGDIVPVVDDLVRRFGDRVVRTRFVRDPAEPGQWRAYYDAWPDFRVPPDHPVWDLLPPAGPGATVVDEPTFSKWGDQLVSVVGEAPLVMCGVATECCVLATALAAADAGRPVTVVADACAGGTREAHEQALALLALNAPLVTLVASGDL